MESNYEYRTPHGYGDTFFVIAYNGGDLTDGQDAYNQKVNIENGDFVLRYWSGLETIATSIQLRDRIQNPFFSAAALLSGFSSGVPVLPEKVYPESGYIGFDLLGVNQRQVGASGGVTLYSSQLCFFGVRRRKGVQGDPMLSKIGPYYEKPYLIQYPLQVTNYGLDTNGVAQPAVLNLCYVPDYDFVLKKIRVWNTDTNISEAATPTFSIMLYNTNGIETVSNIPIMAQRMVNFPVQLNAVVGSDLQRNYFPTPPILYRANSNIRFEISSLLLTPTALPQNYVLEFVGSRRYPCK